MDTASDANTTIDDEVFEQILPAGSHQSRNRSIVQDHPTPESTTEDYDSITAGRETPSGDRTDVVDITSSNDNCRDLAASGLGTGDVGLSGDCSTLMEFGYNQSFSPFLASNCFNNLGAPLHPDVSSTFSAPNGVQEKRVTPAHFSYLQPQPFGLSLPLNSSIRNDESAFAFTPSTFADAIRRASEMYLDSIKYTQMQPEHAHVTYDTSIQLLKSPGTDVVQKLATTAVYLMTSFCGLDPYTYSLVSILTSPRAFSLLVLTQWR